MARTPYPDPDAEEAYQSIASQGSKPSADVGVRPEASFGGRSIVEVNSPELGPDDSELEARKRGFERQKQKDRNGR